MARTPAALTIPVAGPFDLAASARFLAGFSPLARATSSAVGPDAADDDALRLAFALDGTGEPAGVALRQAGGRVEAAVHAGDPERAVAQAARILALDVDGTPMEAIAVRDPVVAGLRAHFGDLRPVLFASPFEAGVWALLTQRTRMAQAVRLRDRIAEGLRPEVVVDGRPLRPFPAPRALLDLEPVPGLPLPKVEWLRELARAAADGILDAARLRAMPHDEALRELRELPGVGAFSAELILARGAGAPDLLPRAEPRLRRAVALAYGLRGEPSDAELAQIADAWRPLRSWVVLMLRAAHPPER